VWVFIRNKWYIVADPLEVSAAVVSRTILGNKVVIFRGDSGVVAILDDRCPHRLVPLSLGKVRGDTLQCAYHGASFDQAGQCVHVPGQADVPGGLAVRSYPATERHGYIWGWFGDGEADPDEVPGGFAVSGDPNWFGGYGMFESIKADYRIINDNLIDITHAEFVHPESFGGAELHFYRRAEAGSEFVDRGMTFSIEQDAIHFRTHASQLGMDGGPFWRVLLCQSRGVEAWPDPIDFRMEVSWWAPSYTSFHISVKPLVEDGLPPAEIYNLHALTPETETSCHYFYRSIRNYGDDSLNEQFTAAAIAIFGQDKPILEAQQDNLAGRDLFDLRPTSFNGDRLQLEARKILMRLERTEHPALTA
jgi:phenylpropionate dioxygenase-like ring-hydroxylating dioxygenase large terminal subunit